MIRTTLALALLAIAAPAAGAADAAAAATAPEPAPGAYHRAPRPGDRGTFRLRDGRWIAGELVTTGELGDVVRLRDGGRAFLAGHSVVEVYPDGPPPRGWGVADGHARAFLRDGRIVEGRLVAREDDALRLELADGAPLAVGPAELDEAYDARGRLPRLRAFADPARPRALATPTAFLLDHGEVAAGARLLDAGVSAGLFDWAMVSARSTVPLGYAERWSGGVTLDARVGTPVTPWLRVAAGCEAYLASDGNVISLSAAATLGSRDRSLTLHAGPAPLGAERLGTFGDTIASAAGYWRVHRRVALLAETWLGLGSDADALGAVGARLIGRRYAVDVGAAATTAGEVVPFLALDLTLLVP